VTWINLTDPRKVPDGQGFSALVFDWDGTMVDSREVNFHALRQAMADCGVVLDPDFYWVRQGMASPELLVLWESEYVSLPEPIATIIDRCRQYNIEWAGTVEVIKPMAAVAKAAHARGQLLAVASNASAINLRASMHATGLADLFHAVATWSDVPAGRGKPHPDIFLLAASRLDIPPAQCPVYEDAEEGVAGALAAGMTVFNVRTGRLSRP